MNDIDPKSPATLQAAAELILEAAMAGDWQSAEALERLIQGEPVPVPSPVNPESSNVNRYVPPVPKT